MRADAWAVSNLLTYMIIASSEIRKSPRPGITIGENVIWVPGRGKMHGERRLLEWENSAEAQAEGWRLVEGVGATRDMCAGCVFRLRVSRLRSFTPMKQYPLRSLFSGEQFALLQSGAG